MYVTDSLFYLQHLVGGGKDDDNRQMFSSKYRDIMDEVHNPKKKESANDIRERMISKSMLLVTGEKE
jgi:hypothetical protein